MSKENLILNSKRLQIIAGIIKENTEYTFKNELDEKESFYSVLSDVYKEKYGLRPRGIYNFDKMSLQDIKNEIDELSKMPFDDDNDYDYNFYDYESEKPEEYHTVITRHDHDLDMINKTNDEYDSLGSDEKHDLLTKTSSIKPKFAKKHSDINSIKENITNKTPEIDQLVDMLDDLIDFDIQEAEEQIKTIRKNIAALTYMKNLINKNDPWEAAVLYKSKFRKHLSKNTNELLNSIVKKLG